MRRIWAVLLVVSGVLALASVADARVLRVGSYHGVRGQYRTIQAAVDAARPGDWILIGPGDYKTRASSIHAPRGHRAFPAGVVITTRDLHIRGMNRNRVIVDGTRPHSAVCSRRASAQNFGLRTGAAAHGYEGWAATADRRSGENGLLVYRANHVSIENLTVCNFLGGARQAGNEVWWNGYPENGRPGGHGFRGAYLTATSTYLKGKSAAGEFSAAQYGLFTSNWTGGTWNQVYASNFNDSGFYIGACKQYCDQTVDHAHGQYNALGYSGSNSGGRLVVERSEFDHNEDGFDTNSQNGDEPSPQNGACPRNGISRITHTHSCWVFIHNYVHDNNNPNVPAAGSAAAGPVGTGMSVSGGRNDTVMDNRFVRNDAWGVIFVPYPDNGPPCTGGTSNFPLLGHGSCLFDEWGDALLDNRFAHNGGYGNPTNGDFAQVNFENGRPTNCYSGNTQVGGGPIQPASAAAMQTSHPSCNGAPVAAGSSDPGFTAQLLCDSQVQLVPGVSSCPAGTTYPRVTKIVMHPLPKHLKTMPNPCKGVPGNAWCGHRGRHHRHQGRH